MFSNLIVEDLQTEGPTSSFLQKMNTGEYLVQSYFDTYESFILGNNRCLGCMEIWSLKYFFEFFSYHLDVLWPFFQNRNPLNTPLETHRRRVESRFQVSQVVTRNFALLADILWEKGLYYRRNVGFISFSAHDVFAHDTRKLDLMSYDFGNPEDIWFDLTCFTLISQVQLYLSRTDLLSHSGFHSEVEQLVLRWLDQGETPADGLLALVEILDRIEQEDQSTQEFDGWVVMKPCSYYESWLKCQRVGVQTKVCGLNYTRIRNGKPAPVSQNLFEPRHGDAEIAEIVDLFQSARESPDSYLSHRIYDLSHEQLAFAVEGITCGLAAKGHGLQEIETAVSGHLSGTLRRFLHVGIGINAALNNFSSEAIGDLQVREQQDFMNGFGFGMGLGFSSLSQSSILLPRVDMRQPYGHRVGAQRYVPTDGWK